MATDVRQNSELLNSWKEISNYVGRGVRTVQRWERDFGLPVRRPGGHVRGSVIAMRKDIDEWLGSRSARQAVESSEDERSAARVEGRAGLEHLNGNMSVLRVRYSALLEENKSLRENLARMRAVVQALRKELRERGAGASTLHIAETVPELALDLPTE